MSALIHFGADGWHARAGEDFTDGAVSRVADAAARVWSRRFPGAIIYVGFDARPGAEGYARTASSVLAGHGFSVKLSDRAVPTPVLAWTVSRDVRACGGLMVTGSSNPIEYLGIKLRVADGGVGTREFYEELEAALDPDPTGVSAPFASEDLMTPYLDGLVASVDGEAIAAARLKVVYDPLYGAARGSFASVLRVLGVEVAEIHGAKGEDPQDVHPEPVEPWVDECEQTVVSTGACAGLVSDGDGLRAAAIDERGRYVDAQKIAALVLRHMVENGRERGGVVLDVASSALVRKVAESHACRVSVKPIGEQHIYEAMEGRVLLGSTASGSITLPSRVPDADGLFVSLLLCELLAASGKTLGQLVDELEAEYGRLVSASRSVRLEPEAREALGAVLPGLNPATIAGEAPAHVSHRDGLRLEMTDGSWLLVRPCAVGVTVCAESDTPIRRDALLAAGRSIAQGNFD